MRYPNAALAGIFVMLLGVLPARSAQLPDQPLSPHDLVEIGFPATDHVWDGNDYAKALTVLQTLKPSQYPSLSNPQSAPVIAQMTSPDALKACANDANALAVRLMMCGSVLQPLGKIMSLYSSATIQNKAYIADAVRMMAFALDVAAEVDSMGGQLGSQLDKDSPTYNTQMTALEAMHKGLLMMLQGMIGLLDDPTIISADLRVEIASALAKDYPRMAVDLPPLTRVEFDKTLRKCAAQDPSPEVRAALVTFASN